MKGSLLILLTAVLWSTAGAVVKLLPWSAFAIASIRGLICLTVLMLFRGRREKKGWRGCLPRVSRANVLVGMCMFGVSTFFTVAVKLTSAANAIVLEYISPVLMLLYSILIEKKKPGWKSVCLTGVVFGGCVLAFASQLTADGILGNFMALMSGVSLTGQIIFSHREDCDPLDGLIIGCTFSFALLLPWVLMERAESFTAVNLMYILFLGLFQYGLANLCYAHGIKHTSGITASMLLTFEPILTPVWSYVTMGEQPGILAIIGLMLVVFGAIAQALLSARDEKKAAG